MIQFRKNSIECDASVDRLFLTYKGLNNVDNTILIVDLLKILMVVLNITYL